MTKVIKERFNYPGISIVEARLTVSTHQTNIALALRRGDQETAVKRSLRLVRSKAARILAVHRVITNKGYRSAGYKDKKPNKNVEYINLVNSLWQVVKKPTAYKAKPLRRVYFPKPQGGVRPISIPTYFDRAVQGLYKLALDVWAEEQADKHSYGFRPYRSPQWAAHAVWLLRNRQSKRGKYNYVLNLDIKKCFDTISHDWMMENIPFIPRHILWEWFKSGYIELDNIEAGIQDTTGVPQGGMISPTLANMVLDGMEQAIFSKMGKNARLIRFADDAVILCESVEDANIIKEAIQRFLDQRGLALSEEKTYVTSLSEGESFIFVGFRFYTNKVTRRFLYDIPPQKMKRVKDKVTLVMKKVKNLPELFIKTNQIIRGFCYAHDKANTKKDFRNLAFWLNKRMYWRLFQFYKTKPGQQIMQKVLGKKATTSLGKLSKNSIMYALDILHKIRVKRSRHRSHIQLCIGKKFKGVKKLILLFHPGLVHVSGGSISTGLNAYHPEDQQQLIINASRYLKDVRKLALAKTQYHCGECGCNLLDGETQWEIHHICPKFLKGAYSRKNIIALCKECHLAVTNIVKARDITGIEHYITQGVLDEKVLIWAQRTQTE